MSGNCYTAEELDFGGRTCHECLRRVQEQPGRVVGEVATEAAILAGTMGFGAVVKGDTRRPFCSTVKSNKSRCSKNQKRVCSKGRRMGHVKPVECRHARQPDNTW